jgi:hypothetical protein
LSSIVGSSISLSTFTLPALSSSIFSIFQVQSLVTRVGNQRYHLQS